MHGANTKGREARAQHEEGYSKLIIYRESLVLYRQPRAIRHSPDRNYLAFISKGIASSTPYSQGFRLLYRHSQRRLGSPWVDPIKAAIKRLKLATYGHPSQVQLQPCPYLPTSTLSSSAGFRTHFTINIRGNDTTGCTQVILRHNRVLLFIQLE